MHLVRLPQSEGRLGYKMTELPVPSNSSLDPAPSWKRGPGMLLVKGTLVGSW